MTTEGGVPSLSHSILYIISFLTLWTKFHHKEQQVIYNEFSRMPYPEIYVYKGFLQMT